MDKIKIGIIGASSISAEILLKILLNHKFAEIKYLVSQHYSDVNISKLYKNLYKIFDKKFDKYIPEKIAKECNLIFLCRGPNQAVKIIPELIKYNNNLKFIDLSGDFRLKNHQNYLQWYSFIHTSPDLLKESVYGLPEIYKKQIKKTKLVANPGCYSTGIILGLIPVLKNNLLKDNTIICDSYSGFSGAGRQPNEKNLSLNTEANIITYKLGNHQHIPEIKQEIENIYKNKIDLVFVPHVVPFKTGIMSTIFVKINKNILTKDIIKIYNNFYKNKPFVRILDENEYPEIKNIQNSNFCDIGIKCINNNLIIITAIDNLIKGASGQAVQNMNIMFDIPETEGLLFHL